MAADEFKVAMYERYIGGECQAVWDELTEIPGTIPTSPQDLDMVVEETMRRCRHNIEKLVTHLSALGFAFLHGEPIPGKQPNPYREMARASGIRPYSRPDKEFIEQLARVEERFGHVPTAVRAWYERVGAVCLMGDGMGICSYFTPLPVHDQEEVFADPLVIDPPSADSIELVGKYREHAWTSLPIRCTNHNTLVEQAIR